MTQGLFILKHGTPMVMIRNHHLKFVMKRITLCWRRASKVTYNALGSPQASWSTLAVINACDKTLVYRGEEQAETDTEDRRLSPNKTVKIKCPLFYNWNNWGIRRPSKQNNLGWMRHDVMAGKEVCKPVGLVFKLLVKHMNSSIHLTLIAL